MRSSRTNFGGGGEQDWEARRDDLLVPTWEDWTGLRSTWNMDISLNGHTDSMAVMVEVKVIVNSRNHVASTAEFTSFLLYCTGAG